MSQPGQTQPDSNDFSLVRTAYVRTHRVKERYEEFWRQRTGVGITPAKLEGYKQVWIEVGAGSGDFFMEMARVNPDTVCIAIERDRMRGKALVKRSTRTKLPNLLACRGNVVPTFSGELQPGSVDRIFILYPAPWFKNAQRKNRWYNHPVMGDMVRALKPGGKIIWASDQKFYIDEARFACEQYHGLTVDSHGPLSPHPENRLHHFTGGRTKFETTFLRENQPCYELIVTKK